MNGLFLNKKSINRIICTVKIGKTFYKRNKTFNCERVLINISGEVKNFNLLLVITAENGRQQALYEYEMTTVFCCGQEI